MDDRELKLSVTGMTCAACASSVERVLSGIDPITKAEVNLMLEKATISFPGPYTESQVKECVDAITGAGFGAMELLPALKVRRMREEKCLKATHTSDCFSLPFMCHFLVNHGRG